MLSESSDPRLVQLFKHDAKKLSNLITKTIEKIEDRLINEQAAAIEHPDLHLPTESTDADIDTSDAHIDLADSTSNDLKVRLT